jgi:hypothetical protein
MSLPDVCDLLDPLFLTTSIVMSIEALFEKRCVCRKVRGLWLLLASLVKCYSRHLNPDYPVSVPHRIPLTGPAFFASVSRAGVFGPGEELWVVIVVMRRRPHRYWRSLGRAPSSSKLNRFLNKLGKTCLLWTPYASQLDRFFKHIANEACDRSFQLSCGRIIPNILDEQGQSHDVTSRKQTERTFL